MLKLVQLMTALALLVTVSAEPTVLKVALPAATVPPVGKSVGAASAGKAAAKSVNPEAMCGRKCLFIRLLIVISVLLFQVTP
jgi:hypothetical protein